MHVDEAGRFNLSLSRVGMTLLTEELATSPIMAEVMVREDSERAGWARLEANGGIAVLVVDVEPGSVLLAIVGKPGMLCSISIDGVAKPLRPRTKVQLFQLTTGKEKIVLDYGTTSLTNWRYGQTRMPPVPL